VGLSRRERVDDLREMYGAVYVESADEMLSRMTPAQRALFGRLPAGGDMPALVARALAARRLMRRALRS